MNDTYMADKKDKRSFCKNCKDDIVTIKMCTTNSTGKHHSYGGRPAVEYADGSKWWFHYGLLHRTNGPTAIHANGRKVWYQNGKRHRLDGPATIRANGDKSWYIEGKELTEEEWKKEVRKKGTRSSADVSLKESNNNLLFGLVIIPAVIILGLLLRD